MLEDKDYVMRMIHESIRMLIRLIFNRDIDKNEDMGISLETAELYQKLITMADAGEINEAENLLRTACVKMTRPVLRRRCFFMRS